MKGDKINQLKLPANFSYTALLDDIGERHKKACAEPRIVRAPADSRDAYAAGLIMGVSIALRALKAHGVDVMR